MTYQLETSGSGSSLWSLDLGILLSGKAVHVLTSLGFDERLIEAAICRGGRDLNQIPSCVTCRAGTGNCRESSAGDGSVSGVSNRLSESGRLSRLLELPLAEAAVSVTVAEHTRLLENWLPRPQ